MANESQEYKTHLRVLWCVVGIPLNGVWQCSGQLPRWVNGDLSQQLTSQAVTWGRAKLLIRNQLPHMEGNKTAFFRFHMNCIWSSESDRNYRQGPKRENVFGTGWNEQKTLRLEWWLLGISRKHSDHRSQVHLRTFGFAFLVTSYAPSKDPLVLSEQMNLCAMNNFVS